MMIPISKPQADALTALAVALRPADADPWDHAGVRAAIADVRHDHDVRAIIGAVVAIAIDPDVRTPGMLRRDGAHWPARPDPTPVPSTVTPPPPVADAAAVAARGAAACRAALAAAR